jgi:hypothetical protein
MITLRELLSIPIKCSSITIMIYNCTYEISGKLHDTYEYHIQLKHTHKRLEKNLIRLAEEHGDKVVKSIEYRDKGDILLKIKG